MKELIPEKVGPYDVLGPLATGGMAEVYLARTTGPGGFEKQVVIKRGQRVIFDKNNPSDISLLNSLPKREYDTRII